MIRKGLKAVPRNAENILRSVLDSIAEGVIVADSKGKFIVFNRAARKLLGRGIVSGPTREWSKAYGVTFADRKTVFPFKDLPLFRALRGESVDDIPLLIRRPGKRDETWINASARPFRDAPGATRGGVVVFRDITERKKAERDIVEINSREQIRLGQELHDGLCQTLIGARFLLRSFGKNIKSCCPNFLPSIQELQTQISSALDQADGIARGLFPVELETHGLLSALQELATKISRRYRLRCRFTAARQVVIDDITVAAHVYRIAQEAIHNAIKGGRARAITVSLIKHGNHYVLNVRDDGVGFVHNPRRSGMGLRIMAYRAGIINAQLHFRRRKPHGTIVECVLPPLRTKN